MSSLTCHAFLFAIKSSGAHVLFHSLLLSPSPCVEILLFSTSCKCISSYSKTALCKEVIFFNSHVYDPSPSSLFRAMIHTSRPFFYVDIFHSALPAIPTHLPFLPSRVAFEICQCDVTHTGTM